MVIDFIKGNVAYRGTDFVVLEVGGIGYQVYVTNFCTTSDVTMLFTHFVVREDAHILYGFKEEKERDFFRLLLSVSGVGPKAAMGILSNSDIGQLIQAVKMEDIHFLTRLPGIGKKTAQRMILELKDKLKGEEVCNVPSTSATANIEVLEALKGLGYNDHEARKAMERAKPDDPSMSTEDWIKRALQATRV